MTNEQQNQDTAQATKVRTLRICNTLFDAYCIIGDTQFSDGVRYIGAQLRDQLDAAEARGEILERFVIEFPKHLIYK